MKLGQLSIVGIGPGNDEHITPAALQSIREAEFVIGYTTYIALVRHHLGGKQVTRTGMTEEIGRARQAVDTAAAGHSVALISSGDSGVYGMAGLVFEVLRERGWKRGDSPQVRLVPGVTAANSCASLVGAPLIHDTCRISLSDLLTPWPVIEKRLENAAQADFVITLYNPASGRRQRQILEAARIISQYRAETTPVALVKSAYRRQQSVIISDLKNFLDFEIGMNTTVLVGSSNTFVYEGYMVTPRGHANKYRLDDGSVLDGQRPAVSLNCEGSIAQKKFETPERKLQITKIPGAFMKTVTETVTETIDADEDPSVQSAREALAILDLGEKGIDHPEVERRHGMPTFITRAPEALSIGQIAYGARLAGALIFLSDERCFLIGEPKEPCNFEDHGLCLESVEQSDARYRECEIIDREKLERLSFEFLFEVQGEEGALELYQRLVIHRNNSVSERLMNLVREQSPRSDQQVDARWLTRSPLAIWNIVRETVLKCS